MGMMPQEERTRGSRAPWGWRVLQWFPGYAVGSPQGDLLPPQKNWASLGAQAYSALVRLLFLNACRALSFSRPVPQPSICTLLTPQGLPVGRLPHSQRSERWAAARAGVSTAALPLLWSHASLAAPCARPASARAPASEQSSQLLL